jgi:hypothetical protein
MVTIRTGSFAICAAVLAGCNVESTTADTGGSDATAAEGCPAGAVVVMSDFVSTQVALVSLEGRTQSGSFISTASTMTGGLAFALSGDVVLPGSPTGSGQVVLLDRFGTNVITWIDPGTAEVRAQLPVGTGFESNPQDYVEVGDGRAFVSRWESNAAAGSEPFDAGGDVLVIDVEAPAIVARIPMPVLDDLPPRPGSLARFGDAVVVTLERVSADFGTTGDARLVGVSIETQAIEWEQPLSGLKGCGRPTLSPDAMRVAVACTGAFTATGEIENLAESALLLLSPDERPFMEVGRFPAADLAGEPIQKDVTFADARTILFKTQTPFGGMTHNRWMALDLETRETTTLSEASPDDSGRGRGVVYGGSVCAPGCTNTCLLADADQGVLRRAAIAEAGVELLEPSAIEASVGLPPRGLGLR